MSFSSTIHIVRFYHRGKWETYEEYGPTMRDVAIQRATELSVPFGAAELRVVQVADKMSSWEDGILFELIEYRKGQEYNRFERFK